LAPFVRVEFNGVGKRYLYYTCSQTEIVKFLGGQFLGPGAWDLGPERFALDLVVVSFREAGTRY
jgi:hypothetical protein